MPCSEIRRGQPRLADPLPDTLPFRLRDDGGATRDPHPARRSLLDTAFVQPAAKLDQELRQLHQIPDAARGTTAGERHERVRVPAVRQRPIDRPQPAIFAPEVERVFPPVPVDEDDRMFLPIPWMEGVLDAEPVPALLERGCS